MTSYTSSVSLEDERHQTLRDAIVKLCLELCPMDGPPAVIRTDPAPGFKALVDDPLLSQVKNPNKNRIAERAVQELETELLRQEPLGAAVSPLTLAVATSALNSRICSCGLSLREMWTQPDQFSNQQLPLADDHLIALQHEQHLSNHPPSERSKAPLNNRRPAHLIVVGDLVYLHSDRYKSQACDRYLIVAIDPPFCDIKSSLDPNYTAHLTASNLLSASRYLPTWLIPYMLLASVADTTWMTKTILIPHLTPHPRCLTSLMLSLLQPSI